MIRGATPRPKRTSLRHGTTPTALVSPCCVAGDISQPFRMYARGRVGDARHGVGGGATVLAHKARSGRAGVPASSEDGPAQRLHARKPSRGAPRAPSSMLSRPNRAPFRCNLTSSCRALETARCTRPFPITLLDLPRHDRRSAAASRRFSRRTPDLISTATQTPLSSVWRCHVAVQPLLQR